MKKRESNSLSSSLKRLPKQSSVGKQQKNIPRQINYVNSFNKVKSLQSVEHLTQSDTNDDNLFSNSVYQSNSKPISR